MQPNTQNPQTTAKPAKKSSTGSSKIGAVLSILALIMAAIGHLIANARFKSQTPVTNAGERAGELVAQGTTRGLATIFSVPLLVGAIVLGIIAIILVIVKLRKVRGFGFVTSTIWVLISVWAIRIAAAGFDLIRAKPS